MRTYRNFAVFLLIFMLIVPYAISLFVLPSEKSEPEQESDLFDMEVLLYRTKSKKVEKIKCYDYICGVVAGEMPANYHIEALKAQAVAAFTYTVNKMNYVKENPESDIGHSGAYVCDDYTHCKAYLDKDSAKEKWGKNWYEKYYPNIELAVSETLGQVITYGDTPVNAVFHAISNGITCSAEEVWGTDVPYLQSVECEADKQADSYETQISLTHTEFKNVFLKELGVELSDNPDDWLGKITRSESGMVDEIVISGTSYSGTHIRKLFSLRSASFDIKVTQKNVIFIVRGYGHGVGMSQYGANAMANEGKTYKEILEYFYSGTKIENYII